MDDALDSLTLLVSILFILVFVVCVAIIGTTPQMLTGYNIEINDLYKGESFTVTALSPSVEKAEFDISATSDYSVFVFTGDQEFVALQKEDGSFYYEVRASLGEWQAFEADNVDIVIKSTVPLKVTADRGLDYHIISYIFAFVITLLVWMMFIKFLYL